MTSSLLLPRRSLRLKSPKRKPQNRRIPTGISSSVLSRASRILEGLQRRDQKDHRPGAKTVLKNTGVVLVSVAVVGVVIYAIDQGLSFLVSKLIELAQKTGENKETAAAILSMINLGL
mgnify:CR=1 FL=1